MNGVYWRHQKHRELELMTNAKHTYRYMRNTNQQLKFFDNLTKVLCGLAAVCIVALIIVHAF